MRDLSQPPQGIVDPATRAPRIGSYRGGLGSVRWEARAGAGARLVQHKRWMYVAIATDEVFVAIAVVALGYAANAFVNAYDAGSGRWLDRRSWMGAPFMADVGDTGGEGCRASFLKRNVSITIGRPASRAAYTVKLEAPALSLEASLDASHAPPAIGAVARVGDDRYDATEKRALLAATGTLRAGGRTVTLDGGLAGYDFTSGLLPRRTRWRWAFGLGRTTDGAPFGVNLVEGFVGEAECAAWVGDDLLPLAEGRFAFDRAQPERPWRVRTADGAADLTMTPGAVHAEKRDLVVARSRFVQPCGAWSGSIALPGRAPLVIGRALGVAEDQDVVW